MANEWDETLQLRQITGLTVGVAEQGFVLLRVNHQPSDQPEAGAEPIQFVLSSEIAKSLADELREAVQTAANIHPPVKGQ